jgi:hypothetical protein
MFSYNEYKNIININKAFTPIKDFADVTKKLRNIV